MIAGIGPVLGEGTVGYFYNADGQADSYGYAFGVALYNTSRMTTVANPYSLRQDQPKVAVLTDGVTASAGESTAIAFIGRRNTRTFGTPTCGYTTGVSSLTLSDGAKLNLATSTMADRTGRQYGGQLIPDETIADSAEAVRRAIAWLQQK